MNTIELTHPLAGILPRRSYTRPSRVMVSEFFNNEFFFDSKMYCWTADKENREVLTVIDEITHEILHRTSICGYSVSYVDRNGILFKDEGDTAYRVSIDNLTVTGEQLSLPKLFFALHLRPDGKLLCKHDLGKKFCLLDWPSMRRNWEFESGQNTRATVISGDFFYAVHRKGLKKVEISTGKLVWEKTIPDWQADPRYPTDIPAKYIEVRTEATGIVAETLVLCAPIMLGIDINTGNVRWVINYYGPQKWRITDDGLGWYIREGNIHRLDIAKGEWLPSMPIQFGPALEKPETAQLGAFDMSTTHIIAEVSMRTSAGYTVGHIVGIRRDNGVCEWAVPIEGTVTKLYLLNNRIYATGTFMGSDIETPSSKTLIIEGEGGYIPD
ncbi:MAG TPA: hypothetical protein VM553_16750 [Dongiaceae bacterium]|nr:hypothetical protein [Dongiaceae bacterium]